ncbi:hypothetical protein HN587_04685 [Candidatus Woesearchaeota archaeon]|jgi:hypothetical protein|nr:hypothetical protein [Candidatus Woesearchaeota archaeon]
MFEKLKFWDKSGGDDFNMGDLGKDFGSDFSSDFGNASGASNGTSGTGDMSFPDFNSQSSPGAQPSPSSQNSPLPQSSAMPSNDLSSTLPSSNPSAMQSTMNPIGSAPNPPVGLPSISSSPSDSNSDFSGNFSPISDHEAAQHDLSGLGSTPQAVGSQSAGYPSVQHATAPQQPQYSQVPQVTQVPQQPSQPQGYSNFNAQSQNIHKDIELVNAKLDAIRSAIESINQRLSNIERIAKGDNNNNHQKYQW